MFVTTPGWNLVSANPNAPMGASASVLLNDADYANWTAAHKAWVAKLPGHHHLTTYRYSPTPISSQSLGIQAPDPLSDPAFQKRMQDIIASTAVSKTSTSESDTESRAPKKTAPHKSKDTDAQVEDRSEKKEASDKHTGQEESKDESKVWIPGASPEGTEGGILGGQVGGVLGELLGGLLDSMGIKLGGTIPGQQQTEESQALVHDAQRQGDVRSASFSSTPRVPHSSDNRASGQNPGGGAGDDSFTQKGHQSRGLLDSLLQVAGALSFAFKGDPNGSGDGVPGGLNWLDWGGTGWQIVYIVASLVGFVDLSVNFEAFLNALFELPGLLKRLIVNGPRMLLRGLAATSRVLRDVPDLLRGLGESLGSLRSSGFSRTGIERFDELVVGSAKYDRWKRALARRGFTVREAGLLPGTMAEMSPERIITVDPEQFTYLALLHESRHVRQIERAIGVVRNPFTAENIRIFEYGAYEYELRLAGRFGFTAESVEGIAKRAAYYFRKIRFKLEVSPTAKSLWR